MFKATYEINGAEFVDSSGKLGECARGVYNTLEEAIKACSTALDESRNESESYEDTFDWTVQDAATDEGTHVVQLVDDNGEWVEAFNIRQVI